MSLVAGELFVNLGIKGADKTVGALTGVVKGMGEVKSMSLEAKAAIVGAMYALERMVSSSNATGTGLVNFTAGTGVAIQTLQMYQNAARQVGVSNEAMEGSFRSLQATMSKTLLGGGAPAGMARLSEFTGDIGAPNLLDMQANPDAAIRRFQLFYDRVQNQGFRNEVAQGFGLDRAMQDALARGAFRDSELLKASKMPMLGAGTANTLDKQRANFANLGDALEKQLGTELARNGKLVGQLAHDLASLASSLIRLTAAVAELLKMLGLFNLLSGTTKVVEAASKSTKNDLISALLKASADNDIVYDAGDDPAARDRRIQATFPKVNREPQSATTINNNTATVNQNFQHPGTDHQQIRDSTAKGVKDAYLIRSSRSGGK